MAIINEPFPSPDPTKEELFLAAISPRQAMIRDMFTGLLATLYGSFTRPSGTVTKVED